MSYIVILMSFTAISPSIGYDWTNVFWNKDWINLIPALNTYLIKKLFISIETKINKSNSLTWHIK
jgi:hypothetical protein